MIRLSTIANYTAIILLILFSQHVAGQQGAIPCGLNYEIFKTIPGRDFSGGFFGLAIDTTLVNKHRHQASRKIALETVAFNFKTHVVPSRDGVWKTLLPDFDSWFLKLRSNGAYGLAVVFSGVRLMPGESLYVYNQHGMFGPYTNRNIPHSGVLPLDFLPGDEIMIEYDVPAGSKSRGTFVVETLSHAYRNIFSKIDNHDDTEASPARYSDGCYLCLKDDAIAKERRAVVKLVVQYENSTKICTGTLVNNTANDNTPYILTAEHCVSSQSEADRTVFIFDFEDENCIKQTHVDLMLHGAYYRASVFENDFSLLELYKKPPLEFSPYYAGWDISDQFLQGVTAVHHAQGGPKKVSVSNGMVSTSNLRDGPSRAPNAFWEVRRWDVGATESGSSGAPLLNKNSHVIGTLSGGSSWCDAPYNDYFAKLSAGWKASSESDRQLKYWLDPDGSGVQTLSGIDPFEGITASCNTITNVKPGEQQTLLSYTGGEGYFSGYNPDGIASYAEKFSWTDSVMITGAMLNVGSVNKQSPGGLLVSIHRSNDGIPGPALSNSFIPYSRLTNDSLNYIGFYPYVKLAGDFFISYTLSYSPEDSFALNQSAWRSNSENTAFVKLSSGWVPMNTISPEGAGASLGIKVTVCENDLTEPAPQESSIAFYPNPVTTVLIAKLPDHAQQVLRLQVYNLQGREQNAAYSVYENSVVVTTADLAPGIYLVRLSTSGGDILSKFVKR